MNSSAENLQKMLFEKIKKLMDNPFPVDQKVSGPQHWLRYLGRKGIDLLFLSIAYLLSYLPIDSDWSREEFYLFAFVVLCQFVALNLSGAGHCVWRRFGFSALRHFGLAACFCVVATSLAFLAAFLIDRTAPFVAFDVGRHPIQVVLFVVYDTIFTFFGLISVRLLWRMLSHKEIAMQSAILDLEADVAAQIHLYRELAKEKRSVESELEAEKAARQKLEELAALRCLFVRSGKTIHVIRTRQIRYIQADDSCARITTKSAGSGHLARVSLKHLCEAILDPREFVRVAKDTIVRLECIEAIHREKRKIRLLDGTELVTSGNGLTSLLKGLRIF